MICKPPIKLINFLRETLNSHFFKIHFFLDYFKSLILGSLFKKKFKKIHTFVMFIGYPRSGHSIIGALLDAHPNVTISMEWNVLFHLKFGYNRNMIFYSILNNSKEFTSKLNNTWTGYSYKVHNMWQGSSKEILVIGDKKGGRAIKIINKYPKILKKLERIINLPVKYIHVVRNPYDIISTRALKAYNGGRTPKIDLTFFINDFFEKAEIIWSLKNNFQLDIIDIYHEDLINNSNHTLQNLLEFINIDNVGNYLSECSKILYSKPNKSRFQVQWSKENINLVQNKMNKYSFLRRYFYNE